jgi:hypothetical protein
MHLLLPSMWFLSSEAGTGDDDDLSAVSEPIQTGRGQERIAEQVRPFLRGPVTISYLEYEPVVECSQDLVYCLSLPRP